MINIQLTKALVLVTILILVFVVAFNQVVKQHRLKLFKTYSQIALPPDYSIIQNTAKDAENSVSVLLTFQFDEANFQQLLRLNNVKATESNSHKKSGLLWRSKQGTYSNFRVLNGQQTVSNTIHKKNKRLVFLYTKK